MIQTVSEYIANVQEQCAFYGFTYQPLCNRDIIECFERGLTVEQAYCVACDVAGGFDLQTAIAANMDRES